MINLIACLLTLFFSSSSPASEGNADFWQSSLAAEGTGSLRLNIFGEGEAPGFTDVSTSESFATGTGGVTRPLTRLGGFSLR